MPDNTDKIIKEAMRTSRDLAMQGAIELCEMVVESGGCARCCVEQLKLYRTEQHASDAAHDVIEKVRHGV